MFTYGTLGNCCTIQTKKREQARHGGDSGDSNVGFDTPSASPSASVLGVTQRLALRARYGDKRQAAEVRRAVAWARKRLSSHLFCFTMGARPYRETLRCFNLAHEMTEWSFQILQIINLLEINKINLFDL